MVKELGDDVLALPYSDLIGKQYAVSRGRFYELRNTRSILVKHQAGRKRKLGGRRHVTPGVIKDAARRGKIRDMLTWLPDSEVNADAC